MTEKPSRPRSIADDIIDAVKTGTAKWTRQRKSEERHPGNIRYRVSRMTAEPRTTQKAAAWQVLRAAYEAASGALRRLPAKVRQIFYQARPKIMAMTDDKNLDYNYFSQTLLPNYIAEHADECADWNVVYDARGHFEEPHTNRRIGCGTLEVRDYLRALKEPNIVSAEFSDAIVDIVGPAGGFSGIFYVEKEGFGPLFKAVNLANRYDLMIISNKGQSVTAARELVDEICGQYGLPLFVLHDFDVAGFEIFGVLRRDTRRYQFTNAVEVIDLGLRLEDIGGLEREPAAATKTKEHKLRAQLARNGATDWEIEILLNERVELNAMTSDALIEMIERKLNDYGLEKVIPDDEVLAEAYLGFHRSQQLRTQFEEMKSRFEENATEIEVPGNLKERVGAILDEHPDLRWDDAVRIAQDATQLDRVRAEKQKAKEKSGDFTDADEDDPDFDEDDPESTFD